MKRAAVAIVLVAASRVALAGDAKCDYVEVKATATGDIDPSLAALKSKLSQPPFTSYKGFKPLSKGTADLGMLKPQAIALKVGSSSVLLRDRDAKHVALTITIDGANGKRLVDTKAQVTLGDWLLVVDTSSSAEAHFVGLTCK